MAALPITTVVRNNVEIVLQVLRADCLTITVVTAVRNRRTVFSGNGSVELVGRGEVACEGADSLGAVVGLNVECLALRTHATTLRDRLTRGRSLVRRSKLSVIPGVAVAVEANVVGVQAIGSVGRVAEHALGGLGAGGSCGNGDGSSDEGNDGSGELHMNVGNE